MQMSLISLNLIFRYLLVCRSSKIQSAFCFVGICTFSRISELSIYNYSPDYMQVVGVKEQVKMESGDSLWQPPKREKPQREEF